MRYVLTWENPKRESTIITRDDKIISATSVMNWALGKTIAEIIVWARGKGATVSLVGLESQPMLVHKGPTNDHAAQQNRQLMAPRQLV